MANDYTVEQMITLPLNVVSGLLDDPSIFPPIYDPHKLVLSPNPTEDILARQFSIGDDNGIGWHLTPSSKPNSHTQWPSKFQWEVTSSSQSTTPFYKIVVQDSGNLANDLNFMNTQDNDIWIWVYFGLDENHPITSYTDLVSSIDIDRVEGWSIDQAMTNTGYPIIPINQ